MIHNIPQPVFEQFLTDVLAKDPNVDIRKGVSFVSLTQVSASPIAGQVQMLSNRTLREL
jgi:2-polyprenyl-6-methoxyphenol hydroxylase-like FAD-dependent oxidoreductase